MVVPDPCVVPVSRPGKGRPTGRIRHLAQRPLALDRRTFLSGAAVSAAVALAACGESEDRDQQQTLDTGTPERLGEAPGVNRGLREWRLVTTWPKNFPGLGTGAQRLADQITAASEGRLAVKLYAAGELVPAFESFDAVREGKVHMGHAAPNYWINKHPSAPFFGAVPGGLVAQEHNAWVYHGGGQELWDELYGEFGLKAFLAGNTGTQMGGWFQKDINAIEDFQGLKMRIPGLGAEVINRLGGTAVNLPGGEIMPALQSGVIDAAEWVGPWNDLAFGFYKITKNYYGPGFHEPSAAIELMMNKAAWDGLESDLKAIVENAAAATNVRMLSEFTAANLESQRVLVERHGVQLRPFPAEVFREMLRHSDDVVRATARAGDLARRVFESWQRFRNEARARNPYAEQGYLRLRG